MNANEVKQYVKQHKIIPAVEAAINKAVEEAASDPVTRVGVLLSSKSAAASLGGEPDKLVLPKDDDDAFMSLSVAEKVLAYNDANRTVAILCNHQKTVSAAQTEGLQVRTRRGRARGGGGGGGGVYEKERASHVAPHACIISPSRALLADFRDLRAQALEERLELFKRQKKELGVIVSFWRREDPLRSGKLLGD